MSLADAVREQAADAIRAAWWDAPTGLRDDLASLGRELTAGEVAPLYAVERLGKLLRERWPQGFESVARVLPSWALVAQRGAGCTARG